jgi:hypothetical protein
VLSPPTHKSLKRPLETPLQFICRRKQDTNFRSAIRVVERLLEEPGDGVNDALVERRNVVKSGGRHVDAVVGTAGAQVGDLGGCLLSIGVDSDPAEAVGPISPLVRRKGNNGRTVVVSTAAGSKALFLFG